MRRRNKLLIGILFCVSFCSAFADQLTHEFSSPSFSGVGTSSHYLTIDEQEKSRRDEIAEEVESALKEAEREAENTTLAKFLRNLESRIYSQLSRDIAESLFDSEKGGTGGEFELEGIGYWKAKTGAAIFFPSGQMHRGKIVTSGTKYNYTIWRKGERGA